MNEDRRIYMPDDPEHGGCGQEQPKKRDVPFPDERPITIPATPVVVPELVPAIPGEKEQEA
jgi:hypothetical protein